MKAHLLGAAAALLGLAGCGVPKPASSKAAMTALPRASIAVPGTDWRVSYLHAGDPAGRRVIFVHGTPGDATGWADYLAHVPPGFEYIAVDRPGFGRTLPARSMPLLEDQARALEPLLVERAGGKPLLVGHSLGGPVVAQAAVDFPGRVGGLVIAAGSLDPAQERTLFIQRVAALPGVRALVPAALRHTNEELMPLKGELEALAPRLARLRCPVAIVHGTADDLVPFANVAFMRRMLPAARIDLTVLQGRNHFLPWNSRPVLEAAVARVAAMGGPAC